MDQSLYHYSLCITLSLMLFFGLHMLFARIPEKNIFRNFLLSRRLMGTALLVLSGNYCVHLFCTLRQWNVSAGIMMNLATYFLCYWLFSSAMMTLLDNRYITRRLCIRHLLMWLAYCAAAGVVMCFSADSMLRSGGLAVLAVWLVCYGVFLSVRILRTYNSAIRMFENTRSDDIGAYIRWLSVFTYWAVIFGVGCGLLTFLPDRYVYIWILSSIPFYVYLYCCYQNYMLFYETVETAIQKERGEEAEQEAADLSAAVPPYHSDIALCISTWIDGEGYRKPGLTLQDVAQQIHTNRTYLSEYINTVYQQSFRDWIAGLRIEYAKRLMLEQPHLKMLEISVASGFLSLSHFTKTFSEKENCSPARWGRKQGGAEQHGADEAHEAEMP